jgi:hypothetical protein
MKQKSSIGKELDNKKGRIIKCGLTNMQDFSFNNF